MPGAFAALKQTSNDRKQRRRGQRNNHVGPLGGESTNESASEKRSIGKNTPIRTPSETRPNDPLYFYPGQVSSRIAAMCLGILTDDNDVVTQRRQVRGQVGEQITRTSLGRMKELVNQKNAHSRELSFLNFPAMGK
jgi:hypothetical protein